jgi:predicted DNA-binding WGR domain protein
MPARAGSSLLEARRVGMRCGKLPLMPPKRFKTPTGSAPLVQLSIFAEEANLARISHAENMWRFYRMEVWPDLLGGALLMRQWGRIGTEDRRRFVPYLDTGAALNAGGHRAVQAAAGYVDRAGRTSLARAGPTTSLAWSTATQEAPVTAGKPKLDLIDDWHGPETYASEIVGYSLNSGNVTLTLASNRALFSSAGHETKRVVVGRVVLSLTAAQALSFELYDFLKTQGLNPGRKPDEVALQ